MADELKVYRCRVNGQSAMLRLTEDDAKALHAEPVESVPSAPVLHDRIAVDDDEPDPAKPSSVPPSGKARPTVPNKAR